MKSIKYLIVAICLVAFNIHSATVAERATDVAKEQAIEAGKKAYAEAREAVTNVANSETVKVAKTNLNTVMIDILSGVRDAGKEVYGASKEAIRSSVNFAQEQAPLVVKEFLMWHMARAIMYIVAWLLVAIACYFTARWIRKNVIADNEFSEGWIPCIILRVVALGVIIFGIGNQAMTVTKIAIAPKVYIIEYVVDTIQGDHRTANTR